MTTDTADQTGTQAAIMDATYRALCKHGYADLTIQTIADEFEKSKSLLYYHYDTKDEILIAFLENMLDQFAVEDAVDISESPDEQLHAFVDTLLPESPDEDQREFHVALLELRSRALSKDAYREQFTRADRLIHDTLSDILTAGVEAGIYQDVDVGRTAELLILTINGAMLQQATTNDDTIEEARDGIAWIIESRLRANDE